MSSSPGMITLVAYTWNCSLYRPSCGVLQLGMHELLNRERMTNRPCARGWAAKQNEFPLNAFSMLVNDRVPLSSRHRDCCFLYGDRRWKPARASNSVICLSGFLIAKRGLSSNIRSPGVISLVANAPHPFPCDGLSSKGTSPGPRLRLR